MLSKFPISQHFCLVNIFLAYILQRFQKKFRATKKPAVSKYCNVLDCQGISVSPCSVSTKVWLWMSYWVPLLAPWNQCYFPWLTNNLLEAMQELTDHSSENLRIYIKDTVLNFNCAIKLYASQLIFMSIQIRNRHRKFTGSHYGVTIFNFQLRFWLVIQVVFKFRNLQNSISGSGHPDSEIFGSLSGIFWLFHTYVVYTQFVVLTLRNHIAYIATRSNFFFDIAIINNSIILQFYLYLNTITIKSPSLIHHKFHIIRFVF